ncbi:MAG: phage tail tape measure protein [Bacillota bacterium]|nr:MAG: phage tail tape measure protein [Bacillota bacterium]
MAENLGSIYSEIRLRLDRLQTDIAKAKAQLQAAGGVIDNLANETATKFQDRMKNVSDTIRDVGMGMTGAGLAIAGGLGLAIRTTANFDKEMSRVKALAGATDAEFQRLRETAIDLGAKTVYSASEAAQGMAVLAAAGFRTNEIIDAMPGLLNAAAASGEDFASVTDIMVAAMSGFGLQAQDMAHIADVLAAAANASSISIGDLGYTFKYVAPVARSAGQSLEQMAAAAAILGNAGIKADQAGTTLRMALIRLAKPPKEAKKWLDRLGISVTDAQGRMLPLSQIIAQLSTKFRGLSQEQQLAAASAIFGAEAMSGMMALIKAGPEPLERLTREFQKADGTAQQMAETMMDNLPGAVEQLMGALESAAIKIGDHLVPTVQRLTGLVTGLVERFNALPAPLQRLIAIAGAAAAGLLLLVGPMLMLLAALPSIAAGWTAMSTAIGGVLPVLAPIAGVLMGLVGIAFLLYKAWQTNFGGIRDLTLQLWSQVVAKFREAWAVIAPTVASLVSYITERWRAIQPALQPVMQWLEAIFRFVFETIAGTVRYYLSAAVNIITGVVRAITGIIKFFAAILTGDWRGAWEAVKQIVSGALQALWGFFQLWIVGRITGLLGKYLGQWIGRFQGFASNTLGTIRNWASNVLGRIVSWGTSVTGRVAGAMSNMAGTVGRWLGRIVADFGQFVWNAVRQVTRLGSRLYDVGRELVQGLWRGISSLGTWLKNQVLGWAKRVLPGPIENLLGISSPSRVMMGYGEDIAEGLAIGLRRAQDLVREASAQLAGLTLTAMPAPALVAQAATPATAAAAPAQTVYMNAPFAVFEHVEVRSDDDLRVLQKTLRGLYEESVRTLRARGRRV